MVLTLVLRLVIFRTNIEWHLSRRQGAYSPTSLDNRQFFKAIVVIFYPPPWMVLAPFILKSRLPRLPLLPPSTRHCSRKIRCPYRCIPVSSVICFRVILLITRFLNISQAWAVHLLPSSLLWFYSPWCMMHDALDSCSDCFNCFFVYHLVDEFISELKTLFYFLCTFPGFPEIWKAFAQIANAITLLSTFSKAPCNGASLCKLIADI